MSGLWGSLLMAQRDDGGADGPSRPGADAGSCFDPGAAGWVVCADEPGFMDIVGPVWECGDGDTLRLGFLARPDHANRRGVVHGGMLLTFADQVLGTVAVREMSGRPMATVQLDTHFIDAITVGEFVEGVARVERRTRSILFMRGEMFVAGRLIATAQGIWKVLAGDAGSRSGEGGPPA